MKSLFTYFLLCLATLSSAQGWRQTFEGLLSPAGVCQTPDGGVVLLANSIPGGAQGRQVVLSKMDQDGRLQWQKNLGATGDDEGRGILLTAEGHIAVVGKISYLSNNGDAFLALYQTNGQKLWERNYNFGVLDDAKSFSQLADGGFILAVEADDQLRLLRTDASGIELWSIAFPSTIGLIVKHLTLREDGGYVVTLLRNNLPISAPAAVVLQISAAGDLEFESTLPHYSNFVTTDQVRCKPAGDSTFWLLHRDSVYLLDQDTTVLNRWRVDAPFDFYLTDLLPTSDGGFVVMGTNYSFSGAAFSRAYFARFQANGSLVWQHYYDAPSFLHSTWAAEQASDGGYFLSGNYAQNGSYFSYLLRTDALGQTFSNQISGRVFWDSNENCSPEPGEPALAGWLLRLERPNGDLSYTNTDTSGHYHFEAGIGAHKLSVLLPNGLWSNVCNPNPILEFTQPFQVDKIDFPIKNIGFCPLPRVDIGVDYWLHCAANTLVVHYSNAGTDLAADASISLTLDSLLSVIDAELPYTQTGPHTWRFSLGDLPPLADHSFEVSIQADCSTETLERTLCVEANIEPDALCLSPLTGPLLIAEGICDGDSVRFKVINIGLPMTESQPYIVVEDNIIFLQGAGGIQLGTGETWEISFPANGSTWRLEVLQSPNTPDWLSDNQAAAVVEGCSASGGFSTGYVNQFSLYDGGYFSENECRPVVTNAQGSAKEAYPRGWNAAHIIPPNSDLEYALHFQNTTGDTVRVLSLRDTLDALRLDPGSILMGPSSHPYQFDLSGAGVLTFRFMGVLLPDSARAWVKFRVSQQPDLPPGSVILNRGWAYPDFSAPQPTNETFHTVGEPLLTGTEEKRLPTTPAFQAWPIPTTADLTLELTEHGTYTCQFAEPSGRVVLTRTFTGKSLVIPDESLPPGVFFATIWKGKNRVGVVRVVKIMK